MGIEEEIKQGKAFQSPHEKLIVNIMFTNSWMLDQQNKLFKPFQLSSPQYNVLRILRGSYPKACTINSIIDRMIDRMSNASRIVDRLESKGYVERKVNKNDRRARDVIITTSGLAILDEVDKALGAWIKSLAVVDKEKIEHANAVLDALRSTSER